MEKSSAGKNLDSQGGWETGVGRNRIHYTHVLNCQRRNFFNKKREIRLNSKQKA